VHPAVAPAAIEVGAHETPETAGTVIMAGPEVETYSPLPEESAPRASGNETKFVAALAESVTSMFATTPADIVVVFGPKRRHLYWLPVAAHTMFLPADIAAAPAVADSWAIWPGI
jgi:hypothetical protein